MTLDDPSGERQSEPCALPFGLGREERIEDARPDLARNPRAAVGDLDAHPPAFRVVARPEAQTVGRGRVLEGLARVRHEVHDDLLQLVIVGPDERQVLREIEAHLDVGDPELEGQELHRVSQQVIERDVAPLGRVRSLAGD